MLLLTPHTHTHTHAHTHTHTQISAGVRHAAASNSTLPERGVTSIAIPSSIPAQFSALRDLPCPAIHARLLLLNHYSKLMLSSWRLFNLQASTQVRIVLINVIVSGSAQLGVTDEGWYLSKCIRQLDNINALFCIHILLS